MSLPVPRSLSPSKLGSFKSCPLAFRFSAIDRLPEPPTEATVRGTLVHLALERHYWRHPAGGRSREAARAELAGAWDDLGTAGELDALGLDDAAVEALWGETEALVLADFQLEDPDRVETLAVELTLEADVAGMHLRGIIDRLDVGPDGELVVVDYKTGRVPSESYEQGSLSGVQFYALLCEQILGRRPARVQLHYLRAPLVLESRPTEQTVRGVRIRSQAVWSAIERACRDDDFRPRPSSLCAWCSFQELCPAFGAATTSASSADADATPLGTVDTPGGLVADHLTSV